SLQTLKATRAHIRGEMRRLQATQRGIFVLRRNGYKVDDYSLTRIICRIVTLRERWRNAARFGALARGIGAA
ncbi:MAG: hypothetical protein JXR43_07870, partial [Burkholderiaceae bacterium]|nr:hypothetical protein [Burkholderiaceae bacterium]